MKYAKKTAKNDRRRIARNSKEKETISLFPDRSALPT